MTDSETKVSIITVSYNAVKTIEQTIQSVLKQSYQNIEYLIIDGQSTDGTQEIIEKYRDSIDYYVSEQDSGIYYAMNKGILHATGDVIGIINSDDWYEADAVEKVVRCFNSTDAGVVFGEIWLIDHNEKKQGCTRHSKLPPHPAMFVKRDIYQKYGVFDTNYRIAADYELTLRFVTKGVLFEHIDEIFSNFRTSGISNIKKLECIEETYQINLKYADQCSDVIINKSIAEELYGRSKLTYISQNNPEKVIRILKKQFPEPERGIIIFGTGSWGKELHTILKNCSIDIPFFVDNDDSKWGFEFDGTGIFSPEILKEYQGFVLIAVKKYQEEIYEQLQKYSNGNLTVGMYDGLWEKVIESGGNS